MAYVTTACPADLYKIPKHQIMITLRYCLYDCKKIGEVEITAPGACTYTANETIWGNTYYYIFAVPKKPLGSAQAVLTLVGFDSGDTVKGGTITLSALATYDQAFIASGGSNWGGVDAVTVVGGTANDWIDLWAVPDVAQFTRVGFFRSLDINSSPFVMPVPDGYDPVAEIIDIRRGSALSMSKVFVDQSSDLSLLSDRIVTLIAEIHPNGGPNISEYIIIPDAFVSASQSAPDNDLVISNAEGGHKGLLRYAPGS